MRQVPFPVRPRVARRGEVPMRTMRNNTRRTIFVAALLGGTVVVGIACSTHPKGVTTDTAVTAQKFPKQEFDDKIEKNSKQMLADGREIFRYDSFGSEAYWGDQLGLHKAILRQEKGGVGAGLSARKALQLGLKADSDKIPKLLIEVLKQGSVSLDKPDTTLERLRADGVVGVRG